MCIRLIEFLDRDGVRATVLCFFWSLLTALAIAVPYFLTGQGGTQ